VGHDKSGSVFGCKGLNPQTSAQVRWNVG